VLEFPRDGLNWAPVRTVSPEQSPQTNVCATEIAILHSSCRGDFSGAVCHDILNESVRVLGQQAVMESMWTSRCGRVAGAQGLSGQKCVPARRSIRESSRRVLLSVYSFLSAELALPPSSHDESLRRHFLAVRRTQCFRRFSIFGDFGPRSPSQLFGPNWSVLLPSQPYLLFQRSRSRFTRWLLVTKPFASDPPQATVYELSGLPVDWIG